MSVVGKNVSSGINKLTMIAFCIEQCQPPQPNCLVSTKFLQDHSQQNCFFGPEPVKNRPSQRMEGIVMYLVVSERSL
jgi:hypothetical protein